MEQVPIHLKMTLTIPEAAAYSNIGINKLDSMLRSPNCPIFPASRQARTESQSAHHPVTGFII